MNHLRLSCQAVWLSVPLTYMTANSDEEVLVLVLHLQIESREEIEFAINLMIK